MKTILIATDFSPAALNAANYGAAMAKELNAEIILVYICQLPPTYHEVKIPNLTFDVLRDIQHQLEKLGFLLRSNSDKKIAIRTQVQVGKFIPALNEICNNVKPFVVIMGSQGSTAADRLLFGSHAIAAVKQLEYPVITVPAHASFKAIQKVGLALDFKDDSCNLPLREIKMMVQVWEASFHVLNIAKQDQFEPEIVQQAGDLKRLLAPIEPQYHFISGTSVDDAIIEFVDKNAIDLLIVTPRSRSLLDRLIHRNYSKSFVLHSHVPVMALHF